jgi:hypothetical protein
MFPDVTNGNGSSGFIQAAAELGIIQGFPDGSFRPNASVIRGQMAIFIERAFKLTQESETVFSDVPTHAQAYNSIRKILAFGITEGYPNGTFRPDQSLSRSDFSAFLARALDEQFRLVKTPSALDQDVAALEQFIEAEKIPFNGGEISLGDWEVSVEGDAVHVVNQNITEDNLKLLDDLHASGQLESLQTWTEKVMNKVEEVSTNHLKSWVIYAGTYDCYTYEPYSFDVGLIAQYSGTCGYTFPILEASSSESGYTLYYDYFFETMTDEIVTE